MYADTASAVRPSQSCNDIHYFCCIHLRRRRAMFNKDCIGSRVVLHSVTSGHDSTFVILKCWFQLHIFQITDVYQCGKMDILLSLCASRMRSFLLFDFPTDWLEPFRTSSIPCPLLLSLLEFASLEAMEQIGVPSVYESSNYILCLRCDFHDLSVEMIPNAFSWTLNKPPRYMHASFWEYCWIHNFASVS